MTKIKSRLHQEGCHKHVFLSLVFIEFVLSLYNSYRMGKVTIKAAMNKENVKVTPDDLKCASLRELGSHLDAITSALAKALVHMDDKQISMHDLCGTISNHLSQINPNMYPFLLSLPLHILSYFALVFISLLEILLATKIW